MIYAGVCYKQGVLLAYDFLCLKIYFSRCLTTNIIPIFWLRKSNNIFNSLQKKVGRADLSESEIYRFAHQTMIEINEMKPQFEDLDSSLDDTAADYIAEAMMMVVQDVGHLEIEMEELIANREW